MSLIRKHEFSFKITISTLLALLFATCISSSYKPSSIQDVIKNKLNILKGIRDKAMNRQSDSSSAMVIKGRDYGSYGGGMQASYSSNYDTALTALAFLSFGVYLLNLLLMAMNRTAGRRKRDLEWDYEEGDVTSFQELLTTMLGDSVSSYLFDKASPDCSQNYICVIKQSVKNNNYISNWFATHNGLLSFVSNFNLPAFNFIRDLNEDKDCNSLDTTNDCLFLHYLRDSLKRVKNKNKLSPSSDLLQSGKTKKIKRNLQENSSLWQQLIPFLYRVLTFT